MTPIRASLVCLGVGVLFGAASVAADPAPEVAAPDLELLEYLGALVDEDDRWVGPDDMDAAVDVRAMEVVPDDVTAAEVVR